MTGFFISSVAGTAHAGTAVSDWCADFAYDYDDGSSGDHMTGSISTARGMKFEFRDVDTGVSTFVWADWEGADLGCVHTFLDDQKTYEVKLRYEAQIGGNTVKVTTPGGAYYTATLHGGIQPQHARRYSYADGDTWMRLATPTDAKNVLAVALWSIYRRDGGMTETYELHLDTSAGNTYDGNGVVTIGDPEAKYTIAHELGHAVFDAATGYEGYAPYDTNANVNLCSTAYSDSGHKMNSKEHNKTAAIEGAASFYAAMIFNNDGVGADCEYEKLTALDWDADGVQGEATDDPGTFSCASSPAPTINNADYLGQKCLSTGAVNNRGAQYDWMKMLWHLHTDSGVAVNFIDLLALWDDADPDSWFENGTGTGEGYPAEEMQDSADLNSITAYDNLAATYGTDR